MTTGADTLTFKLMISHDLNPNRVQQPFTRESLVTSRRAR